MMLDPLSKRFWSGAGQNGLVSLMYHSITPGKAKPDWPWALSIRDFRDQLNLLADNGWKSISPASLQEKASLPKKAVLITFDDGYADNFLAFEELAKRKMLASWFVVTNFIGQPAGWSDKGAPQLDLLSAQQLKEMADAGMTMGSHTHTHCRLTQVNLNQIKMELELSRQCLSNTLSRDITDFAYPYGLYTDQTVSLVKECGYKTAFTTRTGFGLVNNNVLEVRRVAIMANDSLGRFARKMAFAANDVSWSRVVGNYANRLVQKVSS